MSEGSGKNLVAIKGLRGGGTPKSKISRELDAQRLRRETCCKTVFPAVLLFPVADWSNSDNSITMTEEDLGKLL